MNAMIWLILFVVLVVFEIATMGLTTIWFAALIAFFASLLHATWWLQFVFFIVVSLIMLIFTRPFALRYVNRHTTKTNIDSVIGQTGRVIAQIDNAQASGYVTINGIEWAARSADGSVMEVDTMVTVKSIEGVKVIVERKNSDGQKGLNRIQGALMYLTEKTDNCTCHLPDGALWLSEN